MVRFKRVVRKSGGVSVVKTFLGIGALVGIGTICLIVAIVGILFGLGDK